MREIPSPASILIADRFAALLPIWSVLFLSAILVSVPVLGTERGEDASYLVALFWTGHELAQAESFPLVPRLVGPDYLLAETTSAGLAALRQSGTEHHVLDHPLNKQGYLLVRRAIVSPLPEGTDWAERLVWDDGRGTMVIAQLPAPYAVPLPAGWTARPLPKRVSLRSYLPHEAPVILKQLLSEHPRERTVVPGLSPGADVEVLEGRLVDHIRNLSWDSLSTQLRSRYAYRTEVRDHAAAYIEGAFWEALDGRGSVELMEGFPCGDPDSVSIGPNIIATKPGLGRGKILVTAHYDAISIREAGWDWETDPAPGADDNATGVASMIEILRYLAPLEFEFDLTFVAFACEELFLWGSTAYAESAAAEGDTIWGVFNIDMIGFNPGEQHLEILTNVGSQWMADLLIEQGAPAGWPGTIEKVVGTPSGVSDHWPFWQVGYDAILMIESTDPYDNPNYHTTGDVLEHVRLDQVTATVRMVAGALSALANLPGPDLALGAGSIRARWPGYPHDWYPDAGDTVNIDATIRNLGKGMPTAAEVLVEFYIMDAEGREESVGEEAVSPVLLQGEELLVEHPWVVPSYMRGEVTLKARLRPTTPEIDFDPTNNEGLTTVVVRQESMALFDAYLYPHPLHRAEDFHLHFQLSHEGDVTVSLFSLDGSLIVGPRAFYYRYGPLADRTKPGVNEFTWGQLAEDAAFPASGLYLLTLHAVRDGGGESVDATLKMAVRR